jgi:hypothetical protein
MKNLIILTNSSMSVIELDKKDTVQIVGGGWIADHVHKWFCGCAAQWENPTAGELMTA